MCRIGASYNNVVVTVCESLAYSPWIDTLGGARVGIAAASILTPLSPAHFIVSRNCING
jgi:hypothetical protein